MDTKLYPTIVSKINLLGESYIVNACIYMNARLQKTGGVVISHKPEVRLTSLTDY